jgi:hypothetical protein
MTLPVQVHISDKGRTSGIVFYGTTKGVHAIHRARREDGDLGFAPDMITSKPDVSTWASVRLSDWISSTREKNPLGISEMLLNSAVSRFAIKN